MKASVPSAITARSSNRVWALPALAHPRDRRRRQAGACFLQTHLRRVHQSAGSLQTEATPAQCGLSMAPQRCPRRSTPRRSLRLAVSVSPAPSWGPRAHLRPLCATHLPAQRMATAGRRRVRLPRSCCERTDDCTSHAVGQDKACVHSPRVAFPLPLALLQRSEQPRFDTSLRLLSLPVGLQHRLGVRGLRTASEALVDRGWSWHALC
jgi:hypothetical protein